MTDAGTRWKQVQEIFHAAVELPAAQRAAYVAGACAGDAALAEQVLSMLEADAGENLLLDVGLDRAARAILDADIAAPARIGPYRITRVLGRGGMGVVYLAERADLGSLVAIKFLRDASLSPARQERFLIEQRALARLNHPGIARLYDAAVLADGTPYFVMEYVEGEPLDAYCRRHASALSERLRLFRAACEAVQHAHRHAIVHRDLKPSNILVTDEGELKLLDFGIAKLLHDPATTPDPTRTALRLMTPAYAAPEQIRGGPIGVHTDVYALGVILYQLLTDQLPFDLSNRTPGEAEAVLLEEDAERPSSVAARTRPAGLPPPGATTWADLDVLCLAAMHRDTERRYPTTDALIREIDRLVSGQPLEARPDSVRYRLGKFVRRNRRVLALATAAVVALIVLTGFFAMRLAAARDAALVQAERTQRIQAFVTSLFQGGDAQVGPADTLRVVTLLDRGVAEAGVLDAEPELQAQLFATLGELYQMRGDFARADTLLEAALTMRRAALGQDDPAVAESLIALGLLRVDQARLDEAEALIREGLESSSRGSPPDHPAVLGARAALGRVLQEQGDYAQAIATLNETVRLRSLRAPESAELATDLSELANTHFYAGDYAAADSINRRVLSLNRSLYGDRHPHVADDLINLGAVQFQLGNYEAAEQSYRDALGITVDYYGVDHFETASNLTMLGRALVSQNRLVEAEGLLLRALAIEERVRGPVHPRVASAVNELGSIALLRGDHAEAEARFTRMIDIYRDVYGAGHYLNGIARSNLASVYLADGQNARAEGVYREAVAIFTAALSPEDLNTGIARLKLGRALLRQGRVTEAEQELTAGYAIVSARAAPGVSWLRSARTDLVAVYDALQRPDDAERFRALVRQDSVTTLASPAR